MCTESTLSTWSEILEILTPIFLLIWFCISHFIQARKNLFNEIVGVYADFQTPFSNATIPKNHQLYAGLIMNIRTIDSNGYFKAEMQYAESYNEEVLGQLQSHPVIQSLSQVWGKINYRPYLFHKREPFRIEDNRKYKGYIMVVPRFDRDLKTPITGDIFTSKYSLVYNREQSILIFTLKIDKAENKVIPSEITVRKSEGFNFEPYKNLRMVFGNRIFVV